MGLTDYTGLKIENQNQFKEIYHLFRSAKLINFEGWIKLNGYPIFPIYLEKLGDSYGFVHNPIGTWSKDPLPKIDFKDYKITNN